MTEIFNKHNLIAFWNLQNTYLAKHLWMLDSTHKKIVYAIFNYYMINQHVSIKFPADIY